MYIDTAFIHRGAVYSDPKEFSQHIASTKQALQEQGKKLVVKLHPDHFRTTLPDELIEKGIDLCSNEDFIARLQKCCAAIVEPSSAAVIPALMGIPLLLAKYGTLSEQMYGDILVNYPRSREINDINSFNRLLAEEESNYDLEQCKEWIDINAGPLPADLMPDRVANVIKEIIDNSAIQ